MDPAWGQPRLVESEGSQSSGTTRPYGLDCSGFVAWCYIQQGFSSQQVEELVGYGTWNQWDRSESISFHQLRVGDWAFQNKYPTDQGNHIGICIGFDQKGKPLFLHCASSFDNVVVTGAGDVFRYARRPPNAAAPRGPLDVHLRRTRVKGGFGLTWRKAGPPAN